MKKHTKILGVTLAAALAMCSGAAMAESTYGYNSAGTGTVTATARVNLSVTIPKLILLRVGSSDTAVSAIDTVVWTSTFSIPGTPTTPITTANSVSVPWTGVAPSLTVTSAADTLNVYAWANTLANPAISCSATAVAPTGGPTLADFTVTTTGTLPHPTGTLAACTSTTFTKNVLASGTWRYILGGTPTSWSAGAYTSQVTYTASAI